MKTKKVITIILTVITGLMIGSSGIFKLVGGDEVKNGLSAVGVGDYIPYLGLMEIAFIALFAIPKTMKIGFILLSCYFAGALATELSHQGSVVSPLIPLTLIWVTALLRNPQVFFESTAAKNLHGEA